MYHLTLQFMRKLAKQFNSMLGIEEMLSHLKCIYLSFLQYLATRAYNKTLLIEKLLQRFFCDELAERRKVHEEEMKELSK